MSSGTGGWWAFGAAGLAKLGAAVLPRVRRSLRASRPTAAGTPPSPGAQQPLAADLFSAFDMGAAILRTPDGAILHWSAGCERLFGVPAAEALGRTAHELLGTRFPEGGRRGVVEKLLSTGEWQGELRHRRRNGQPVVVASH